jgi:hypothetical protein
MPIKVLLYVKLTILFLGVTLAVYVCSNRGVEARSAGPTNGYSGAPGENNCTTCHADFTVNSGTGIFRILNVPRNYAPNQVIPITVSISQTGANSVGFQLTAVDDSGNFVGALTPTNTDQTQIITSSSSGVSRNYIEHKAAGTTPTNGQKTWTFNWTAPASRVGRITFYAAGNGGNLDLSPTGDYIYTTANRTGAAFTDYDGDGITDVSVYRNGIWYLNRSTSGLSIQQFGLSTDKVVPGDYDGDGKTDVAVWRPSDGVWYITNSNNGSVRIMQFGLNGDVPVPGDYDNDGKTDIAVWRSSNGVWYIFQSSNGNYKILQFGLNGDKPVPQDYDGDGLTDIAVYRPSTLPSSAWYILRSLDNTVQVASFGASSDIPVPVGDYNGDGKDDIAVFRPGSSGVWYVLHNGGVSILQFGLDGDKPAPGDYNGDGRADIAVFRPSNGTWYVLHSGLGTTSIQPFGLNGDVAVPSAYVP